MQASAGIQFIVFLVVSAVGGVLGLILSAVGGMGLMITVWVLTFIFASLLSSAVRIAKEWERAIVLRLGQFVGQRGPGLFFIVPVLDSVPYVLDLRLNTTIFRAEQTMTKDTVPVDVDAVLFWKVVDPQSAALAVANYQQAVTWASQTALRDIIGRSTLAEMLSERERIDVQLQEVIDRRTETWGTRVESVEIRDVTIPDELQDAMSRQAQAERERQARVILGESEKQIADSFQQAAHFYESNPVALHLRAMNMLYEGLQSNSTLVIVPSAALETMNLGAIAGLTGLTNAQLFDPAKPSSPSTQTPGAMPPTPDTSLADTFDLGDQTP